MIFLRLSRGNANSLTYRIYKKLIGTALGEIKFHKNLHDIITVLAVNLLGDGLRDALDPRLAKRL